VAESDSIPNWRALLLTGSFDTAMDSGELPQESSIQQGELLGGRFRVREFLGRGGMGEVFAAEDTLLETVVAIKVVRPEYLPGEGARQRLMREVRTARLVTHPHVCRIFDMEETVAGNGVTISFLTMELLRGETLAERLLRRPRLTEEEASDIGLQLCSALSGLHDAGIVHRDFKPANVMLVNDPAGLKAMVMDFGLAIAASPDSAPSLLTRQGSVLGTPAYMAPEQSHGRNGSVASDIYALGLVLGQLLTGFEIDSLLDRASFPARLDPSARALLRFRNSHWLRVVERCLVADPDGRWSSVSELRGALVRRRRRFALALDKRRKITRACAAVVIVGAGIAAWTYTARPSRAPHESVVPKTPYDLLEAARARIARYDKGDNLNTAIQLLSQAVNDQPSFAPAYADLAQAYLLRNATTPDSHWTSLADSMARKAVSLNPELSIAHAALGATLRQHGADSEAEKEFRRAIALDPKNAKAYLGLAQCEAAAGRNDSANGYFSRAAELSPRDWAVWLRIGLFEYSTGEYQKAAGALEKAGQLAPDNSIVYRNLGAIYSKLERYDDAASAFQRALEIRPSDAVYTNLGTIRFYQGRYGEAIPPMEAAVRLSANNYLLWGNLADVYRIVPGNQKKALDAYRIAVRLAREQTQKVPDNPDLRSSLAVYLAHSGDVAGAEAELKLLAGSKRHTPGSLFKAALASEACMRENDALRYLELAVREGYPWREIRDNPDLASLRETAGYQEFASRVMSQEKRSRETR
jgi:eukaryotic-like serine/threonine-protein kinase